MYQFDQLLDWQKRAGPIVGYITSNAFTSQLKIFISPIISNIYVKFLKESIFVGKKFNRNVKLQKTYSNFQFCFWIMNCMATKALSNIWLVN